jgi:GrpB-like predicted nucleotidyltransferase (UPF0157 family)
MKDLNDLTDAERGRLFPIILTEYDPKWKTIFEREKQNLLDILRGDILKIEHIGSTSIQGMKSKPTIDILAEIRDDTDLDALKQKLGRTYAVNIRGDNPPPHLTLVKGYTQSGFVGTPVHLHLRYSGVHNEILFRDFLRTHPQVQKEYVELKEKLAIKYKNDRKGYTSAKTEFVADIISRAKRS